MLTHNLIVTARAGCLIVWDVRLTEPIRVVRLGHVDGRADNVRIIRQVGDTVICSLGHELRLVRFPMLADKLD